MEKEKTQIPRENYTGVGRENPDMYINALNQLREKVKKHIDKIKDLMVSDIDIDINVYDTIRDMCDKIEYLLYCDGEYCKFEKSLLWVIDFADNIQRVAGYAKMIDVYMEASKISYEIRKFHFR